MRVKCLAQEHNTMSPAWARTRTARSGVERTTMRLSRFPQERQNDEKNEKIETLLPKEWIDFDANSKLQKYLIKNIARNVHGLSVAEFY